MVCQVLNSIDYKTKSIFTIDTLYFRLTVMVDGLENNY